MKPPNPPVDRVELIAVARGDRPADLLLRGGRLVNVLSGEVHEADVAIASGRVAGIGTGWDANEVVDLDGAFVAPAFIDGHIHVESTFLAPFEFARVVSARGTGAVVSDPHEIANVHGLEGVRWMLDEARGAPADVLVSASSCVPASPLETSGARLGVREIEELLALDGVVGLAEVMDFPAVIAGEPEPAAKIAAADGLAIDGHAPGVSGHELAAYVAAGPGSEHEATTVSEAREKLRLGMRVMLREATPARDLAALLPLVNERSSRRCMLVNDDVSVTDLLERGHLDHHLRMAVEGGVDPVVAIQMVTLNVAEWFGLADRGALAPGRRADVAVLAELERFEVLRTYHAGELVAAGGESLVAARQPAVPAPSVKVDLERLELARPAGEGAQARVVELVPGAIVTGAGEEAAPVADGALAGDPGRDLAKLCVIERHTGATGSAVALVRGFGLREGALGSSVAHDHHNLIIAGTSDAEIERAARALAELGGGLVAVRGDEVLASVPLPIAGLMSALEAAEVARQHRAALDAARALGSPLDDPFMSLSFLGLEVIPELKLTDLGLVDVSRFEIVEPLSDPGRPRSG
jgi:adenine deaminase